MNKQTLRSFAQFAGCIIRWGGGGGAALGSLLYIIWFLMILVSDFSRSGGWPYYDLTYVVLGLLAGSIVGFLLGIFTALVNAAAMGVLIVAFRLGGKSTPVPRKIITRTFALISGFGMFAYCLANLPDIFPSSPFRAVWILATITAIMAAGWAWRASEKARALKQPT